MCILSIHIKLGSDLLVKVVTYKQFNIVLINILTV